MGGSPFHADADPKATNGFFRLGVGVNGRVCDHPTIQVCGDMRSKPDPDPNAGFLLGMLGGLLQGNRVIVMMMNASETEITGFATGTGM